jgi:hypothetical protein
MRSGFGGRRLYTTATPRIFAVAAVGGPAELLDVDVDEFAGPVAFVAADDLPGGPVEVGQAVQTVPGQDPVGGRGGQSQDRADAGGAEFAGLAQPAHLGLGRRRGAVGCGARPAGAVVQALLALGPPAADPLVGRDARDAHLCRDVRDRSARVDTL